MKKLLLPFAVFITASTFLDAQVCTPANAQIDLSANFVRARLRTGGDLWWDLTEGKYIVPKGGQTAAIFAGSLWMGGLDSGGNLHLAAHAYGAQTGAVDFWAGPLDDNGNTQLDDCQKWDKFFSTNSADILAHQVDYAADYDIDGPVPNSILGWPAFGNPHFFGVHGFDLPAGASLAPFFDRDQDGAYNPELGDYPLVQGDEVNWWVYNDNGNVHTQTGALPVKMEVQATAFSYETGPVEAVELTTFYEYKFIYRGQDVLTDFYLSIWVDPDLGCWSDDYIGSVPEENLGYVYNADNNDENCSGLIGYGTDVPVLGVKLLHSNVPGSQTAVNMSKFMYYFNTNSGLSSVQLDPNTGPEYYSYMKGIWKDGTPLSEGGNGYNPGSDPVDFGYPGNPADAGAWTECSANSPAGDRRFLMSFGPYTLQPGAITNLAFAVVWLPSQAHPCPDITALVDAANEVKDFYEQQQVEIATGTHERIGNGLVNVAPNPASESLNFNLTAPGSALRSVLIYNNAGQLVHRTNNIQSNAFTLSRGNLPDGLYFYKVQLENGKMSAGKVMLE